MLSKTNSFTKGKYTFQPTKYDENGNLYLALYRQGCHKPKCKVTGIYKFNEERKLPIQWSDINFHFFCKHADLLGAPLEIRVISNYKYIDYKKEFMRSFMQFVFEWKNEVWSHLNGFSGIDCIEFEFDENIDIKFFNGFRID